MKKLILSTILTFAFFVFVPKVFALQLSSSLVSSSDDVFFLSGTDGNSFILWETSSDEPVFQGEYYLNDFLSSYTSIQYGGNNYVIADITEENKTSNCWTTKYLSDCLNDLSSSSFFYFQGTSYSFNGGYTSGYISGSEPTPLDKTGTKDLIISKAEAFGSAFLIFLGIVIGFGVAYLIFRVGWRKVKGSLGDDYIPSRADKRITKLMKRGY